uniref:Uncharacterized protein n=1 Tax=Rhizochromulina marina TaxID=1034831 RepID=A0A7S2S6W5_9STRA|mmetsp:Transcript_25984/g.75782  ORF Transcript_25984/g.75782 Transcript_25984/m.75782 type:complete len:142 (+) Transcript_25984:69-494(+)
MAEAAGGTRRQCRCPLCGEMIIAASEEECVAHIQSCSGFRKYHPNHAAQPDFSSATQPAEAEDLWPTLYSIARDGGGVEELKVKQLRRIIELSGSTHGDCVEKVDLQQRCVEAATAYVQKEGGGDPGSQGGGSSDVNSGER